MALAGGCQSSLRNRYWILRHGKSIPNEKGLIVSSLVSSSLNLHSPMLLCSFSLLLNNSFQENGILEDYQLASDGILQARLAAESLLKVNSRFLLGFFYFTYLVLNSNFSILSGIRLLKSMFVQELDENKFGLENVRICYSPLARTIHTAKVVASVLNIPFQGPQCKVSM